MIVYDKLWQGTDKGNDTTSTNETTLAKPAKRRSQNQRKRRSQNQRKSCKQNERNAARKTNEKRCKQNEQKKSCKLSAEGTACSFFIFMYK